MINATMCVKIEKPTKESDIKRIEDAVNLLLDVDEAIGKCNPDVQNVWSEFSDAARGLEMILAGKWVY